ncbi:MAG: type II toxin-antitoxin system RelE/ParE family toxin [Cyanobacteriota bacterium]
MEPLSDSGGIRGSSPPLAGSGLVGVARRKLRQLEIAQTLDDLRVPPGNRLEALRGDRAGQHSIRINDQFRLCFQCSDAGFESPSSDHTW